MDRRMGRQFVWYFTSAYLNLCVLPYIYIIGQVPQMVNENLREVITQAP